MAPRLAPVGIGSDFQGHAYPVGWHGMIRQCVRCWRVADAHGRYCLVAPPRLPGATHGYCPACKKIVLDEIDADF